VGMGGVTRRESPISRGIIGRNPALLDSRKHRNNAHGLRLTGK
jgi:hypothetical protein